MPADILIAHDCDLQSRGRPSQLYPRVGPSRSEGLLAGSNESVRMRERKFPVSERA